MGFLSTVIDTVARALTTAHIADTTSAHAASAITNTPAGGLAATDVQAALNELDTEKAALTGATFTGVITFPGATNGGDAAAGDVGEYLESVVPSGSAVSLTNATAADITSLSLSAGDWDITANAGIVTGATTNVDNFRGAISTTSATINAADTSQLTWPGGMVLNTPIAGSPRITMACTRVSISAPAAVYLVARSAFTVSTASAFGKISARRVR